MNKKIKIGDRVVYSPSLRPIICEVKGIMGNYITVKDSDGVISTKLAENFCPITDEEYRRFLGLQQKQ